MAPSRTVRHLRLRGRSRASIARLGVALEDALRVSDLPGDDGRLVLVRRLAVGAVDARGAPGDLPRRLKQAMASGSGEVRHGDDVGAARSNVVWFRDALEAHARLAERVLARTPTDEWYWRLAVPGWRGSGEGGIPDALGVIVRSLVKLREAPAALPAWCVAVCEAGGAEELKRVFAGGDGAAIAEAAGLRVADSPDPGDRGRSVPGAPAKARGWPKDVGGGTSGGLGHGTALDEAVDADTRLPGPAGVEGGTPAWLLELMLRESARRAAPGSQAGSGSPSATPRRAGSRAATPRDVDGVPPVEPPGASPGPERDDRGGESADDQRRPRQAPPPSTPDERGVTSADRPDRGDAAWASSHRAPTGRLHAPATCAGGLLFLINVLSRLDFALWAEGRPDRMALHVARMVLCRALTDSDVPEADPAWAVGIGEDIHPGSRTALNATAGTTARDGPSELARTTDAWSTACRSWLRHSVDMDLETLVLRPARLAVTPTHVDTWFGLSQVDLTVRRAGLDIDPGWVPWLGRVVTFHYEPGDPWIGDRS